MVEPPILPSLNLPTQVIPDPPRMPEAILSVPRIALPSYKPMVAPPGELKPPVGVPRWTEDGPVKEGKPQPKPKPQPPQLPPSPSLPEVRRINIPWTDIEVPVPKAEIVTTAATTAAISVVATLTATSLFNYLVKILKPVFMQAVKRIQKKLGKDGKPKTEHSAGKTN